MGVRGLFEGWHLVILVLVVLVLFGGKRLPDAARGLGRSLRIFKAEIKEMKSEEGQTASGSPSASRPSPSAPEPLEGRVVTDPTVKPTIVEPGNSRVATASEQHHDA